MLKLIKLVHEKNQPFLCPKVYPRKCNVTCSFVVIWKKNTMHWSFIGLFNIIFSIMSKKSHTFVTDSMPNCHDDRLVYK